MIPPKVDPSATANVPAVTEVPSSAAGAVSYRAALKATSITGSSAIFVMLLRVAKSKVIAVLLGPSGMGLFGLLTAATSMVATIVGFGINSSGARQVAAAAADGDRDRIGRVIFTLRRTSLVLGLGGAAVVILLRKPIAELSTGSTSYATALGILGLAVLFQTVNGGQTALLRGLRKISEVAKLRVWGALFGTALAVPLIWLWGLDGVAPAIVTVAALSMLTSWYYTRHIRVHQVQLTFSQLRGEVAGLAGLGAVFLTLGIAGSVVQYATRVILNRELDLQAVGHFQAAAALSMVYVGFVLQAMGLDFMPRLTEVADDHEACNRLVNEQSEISLLLAGPGIVATVVLAPVIIPLLYSGKFEPAIDILRLQCFGVLLKVASWPIAFVLIAKARRATLLLTEISAHAVHLGSFWLLTRLWGLMGAAAAFAILYLFYLPLDYLVVRRITGFGWSGSTVKIMLLMIVAFAGAVTAVTLAPAFIGVLIGLLISMALLLYSYRELSVRAEAPIAAAVVRSLSASLGGVTKRWPFVRNKPDRPFDD